MATKQLDNAMKSIKSIANTNAAVSKQEDTQNLVTANNLTTTENWMKWMNLWDEDSQRYFYWHPSLVLVGIALKS